MTLTELIDKSFDKGFDISITANREKDEVEVRLSKGSQRINWIIPFNISLCLDSIDIFEVSFDKMADILEIKNNSAVNNKVEKAYWMVRYRESIDRNKLVTRARCSKCGHVYPLDYYIGMDLPSVCPQCHRLMCSVPSEH